MWQARPVTIHGPADGWVESPDGRRFWGRAGPRVCSRSTPTTASSCSTAPSGATSAAPGACPAAPASSTSPRSRVRFVRAARRQPSWGVPAAALRLGARSRLLVVLHHRRPRGDALRRRRGRRREPRAAVGAARRGRRPAAAPRLRDVLAGSRGLSRSRRAPRRRRGERRRLATRRVVARSRRGRHAPPRRSGGGADRRSPGVAGPRRVAAGPRCADLVVARDDRGARGRGQVRRVVGRRGRRRARSRRRRRSDRRPCRADVAAFSGGAGRRGHGRPRAGRSRRAPRGERRGSGDSWTLSPATDAESPPSPRGRRRARRRVLRIRRRGRRRG